MKLSPKILKFGVFIVLLQMQGCGEKVTSKYVPSNEVVNSAATGANQTVDAKSNSREEKSSPPKEEAQTLNLDCSSSSVKKEFKVPIQFSELDTGKTCNWGTSDITPNAGENLSKKDAFFRAYLEQIQNISLSAYKKLCHIEVTHLPENIRYDDEIFLLLHGKILASSKNYNPYFDKVDDLIQFNWSKLRGKPYDSLANSKPYCIGASSICSIPPTETSGSFHLNLDQSAVLNYLKKLAGNSLLSQLTFSLVTTGDNDDTDCRHSPIKLELLIKYED
jgi:hypothetical protein